jgi:outer membrane protein assembly factor BamB
VAAFWAVNASACVPPVRFGPERQHTVWTAYLGTPGHDVSAAESLSRAPTPGWHTRVGRAIPGAPAIGETVIATGTSDRLAVLVGRDSGHVLWQQRLSGTIHGGPLLAGDRLYFATEESPDAHVYALRMRTGERIWSTRTGSIEAPLAFDGTLLFAASEGGMILGIESDRGRIRWRRQLAGAVRAAPVPTAAGLVVATTADTLYLLDHETGVVLSRIGTPGAILSTPAVDAAHLYAATTDGRVLAVALPSLTIAWTADAGGPVYGAPALARDTLYVLTRAGRLSVIPTAAPAGAAHWELGVIGRAGPTPITGSVLIAGVDGVIHCIDPATGNVRWELRTDAPVDVPPLVRDGQLVLVGERGEIRTYR